MLRHAHLEDGEPSGIHSSKSFSGVFVAPDTPSYLSEHSGQRRPRPVFWPSGSNLSLVAVCLVGVVLSVGSVLTLWEISVIRSELHAQQERMPTQNALAAIVKLEMENAITAMKAEQSPMLARMAEIKQQVEATVGKTEQHGKSLEQALRSSIDTAKTGLSEQLTATLSAETTTLSAQVAKIHDTVTATHDKLSATHHQVSATHAKLSATHDKLSATHDKLTTLESRPPARPPAATHKPPAAPPPHAPKPHSDFVDVVIRYRTEGLPGNHASVYWLGLGTETEHLYADLPPGMEVHEKSRPGECWRVRDATTGNDLVPRYCASAEPNQLVEVTSHHDVLVDFHLPMTRGGNTTASGRIAPDAAAVELIQEPTAATQDPLGFAHKLSRVGLIARGGHLSVQTQAGTRFYAREISSNSVLQRFTASAEAKQYATIGHGEQVTLEFAQQKGATKPLSVFHVHDDGEEHLYAKLEPKAALRVTAEVGEKWVVREQRADKSVLSLAATSQPFQRVDIPLLR